MKAVIERADMPIAARFRWVESRVIFTGEDAEEYGPVALSTRGNAHVFASFTEAGAWVDANAEHGDFVIHGVKS